MWWRKQAPGRPQRIVRMPEIFSPRTGWPDTLCQAEAGEPAVWWHYVHDAKSRYRLTGPCWEMMHEPGLEPWNEWPGCVDGTDVDVWSDGDDKP